MDTTQKQLTYWLQVNSSQILELKKANAELMKKIDNLEKLIQRLGESIYSEQKF